MDGAPSNIHVWSSTRIRTHNLRWNPILSFFDFFSSISYSAYVGRGIFRWVSKVKRVMRCFVKSKSVLG